MLIKKHFHLAAFIVFLSVLYLIPFSPLKLINVSTGLPVQDYSIHISPWGYILAPFKGISLYFSLSPDIKSQLVSWLSWLIFLYVLIRAVNFKKAEGKLAYAVKSILGIFLVIFSFILLITCILFVPLPSNSLKVENPDEIPIDVHSHTFYSHDGLGSPENNIRYHLSHGFKAWFVTDHKEVRGADEAEALAGKEYPGAMVLRGMEVSKQGQNLLLLGIKGEMAPRDLEKEGADFIRTVHDKYDGVVVVPHWWEDKAVTRQTLVDWGVDGFEVFGHAGSPLEYSEQKAIIDICRKNGLLMMGGSNYHGWGNACDVWTSINLEGNEDREKAILSALRKRETGLFKVIVYGRREPLSKGRYLFEPFVGAFYYFSSLNGYQIISWFSWSILIYSLVRKNPRLVKNIIFLVTGIFLLGKGILFHADWEKVSSYNDILPAVSTALFVISTVSLLIGIGGIVCGKPRKSEH